MVEFPVTLSGGVGEWVADGDKHQMRNVMNDETNQIRLSRRHFIQGMGWGWHCLRCPG